MGQVLCLLSILIMMENDAGMCIAQHYIYRTVFPHSFNIIYILLYSFNLYIIGKTNKGT